jgi:hypothetical protein
MKLESVEESHQKKYKYVATFCLCPRKSSNCEKPEKKQVYFGSAGYQDYTTTASDGDRENYLSRHRPNENWDDPLSPGALSRYILWGATKSLQENIRLFKEHFDL